jgi:hypothetical protein
MMLNNCSTRATAIDCPMRVYLDNCYLEMLP